MSYKAAEVSLQERQDIDFQGKAPPMTLRDEELVARIKEGEDWATEELVNRYQQKTYAIAYHMCSEDGEEAQDLTQEAFLRTFRSLGKFRGDSSFYTWFYRIVVNVCLDSRRRSRRWKQMFSPWRQVQRGKKSPGEVPEEQPDMRDDINPVSALSGKQFAKEIKKSLKSLPERQRLVFQLKVLHGMSIREIAQVIGTAEGTVKSHLFRATRFLREELKEWATP
ncbi:MAG: sigma-70 family RNA polymerase sigma factor [Desulfobacterales bacterium]|nr:sigma-70 family RNA polymerase sigma factor [Desulfobacterales bacterium]